jgi:hypothetical protein
MCSLKTYLHTASASPLASPNVEQANSTHDQANNTEGGLYSTPPAEVELPQLEDLLGGGGQRTNDELIREVMQAQNEHELELVLARLTEPQFAALLEENERLRVDLRELKVRVWAMERVVCEMNQARTKPQGLSAVLINRHQPGAAAFLKYVVQEVDLHCSSNQQLRFFYHHYAHANLVSDPVVMGSLINHTVGDGEVQTAVRIKVARMQAPPKESIPSAEFAFRLASLLLQFHGEHISRLPDEDGPGGVKALAQKVVKAVFSPGAGVRRASKQGNRELVVEEVVMRILGMGGVDGEPDLRVFEATGELRIELGTNRRPKTDWLANEMRQFGR